MKNKLKDSKKYLDSYARYSSIAIQMGVVIAAGVIGGYYLDQWTQLSFPMFTIVLSFVSVAIAIYLAIKDLLKK